MMQKIFADALHDELAAVFMSDAETGRYGHLPGYEDPVERLSGLGPIVGHNIVQSAFADQLIGSVADDPFHGGAHVGDGTLCIRDQEDIGRIHRDLPEVLLALLES